MKSYRDLPFVTILLLVTLSLGCGGAEPSSREGGDEQMLQNEAAAEAAAEAVEYEPAYPAEVSGEGLSEEDVAQQQTGHSHDGGEHSHGPDGHSHDGGESSDDDHDH